ncbi:MAG: ABC transporter permease [Acidobacteria bacterium]|nr:ABC transporter permease [Acidobacteriota bacterium]
MDWLREIFSRSTALFHRQRLNEDLDEELESHVEAAVEENIRRGMAPDKARVAALRLFGGVTQIKEAYRARRDVPLLTSLKRDVFYAVRRLRSSPGFALVVIATLALGIGANTAVFTLVEGFLLRSLPVADPASLYRIGDRNTCCYHGNFESADGDFDLFSNDLYRRFKQTAPEFEQLAAVQAGGGGYTVQYGSAAPRPLRTEFVSGNYFSTLGVGVYLGRPFGEADDHQGAAPVLVISYVAWETEFGRDPSIVGATVYVQRHPFTVAGVAPPGFYGDRIASIPADIWMPLSAEIELEGANAAVTQPTTAWLYALGRLRNGVQKTALEDKLSAQLREWMGEWPRFTQHGGAAIIPRQYVKLAKAGGGIQKLQQQSGANLRLLMILSSVVLLLACANIASLLLARSTTQRMDIAVRMALGAARFRIIRQILIESLLLSCAGGVAALGVSWLGARAILTLAYPEAHYMPLNAEPSWPVLGFALLVSVMTGVVFSVTPAWAASHAQPTESLRGINVASRDRASLPQRTLVILQLAMSLVLLSGTFLLTRSLMNLEHKDFGFQTANRYTFQMDLEGAGYSADRTTGLYRQMEQRLGALPGVTHVSFARYIPMGGNQWGTCVYLQGGTDSGNEDKCFSDWIRVSAQFLDSIGVPVVRGRGFTAQDGQSSPLVAVVNQAFVKKFFPNQDPVGKHFGREGAKYSSEYQIAGVFSDFILTDPRSESRPLFLVPDTQQFAGYTAAEDDAAEKASMFLGSVVLQVAGSPTDMEMAVRKALAEIDPKLPVFRFVTYDSVVAENFNQERLIARLTAAFGILSLILASVGLYGVTSYFVARRTSEIGIRMAVGASRSLIVRMVMRGAIAQFAAGLALGVPASLLMDRLMTSFLFRVSSYDPAVLAAAVVVLGLGAGAAAILPAIRAASLDPVRALRTD